MTGELPYANKTDLAIVFEVTIKKRLPPLPDFSKFLGCQGAKNKLWSLLVRCWAYVPGDRPTAIEVKETVSAMMWIFGVCRTELRM
jgi:hypothetical protein